MDNFTKVGLQIFDPFQFATYSPVLSRQKLKVRTFLIVFTLQVGRYSWKGAQALMPFRIVKDICLNPKRLGLHYTAWVCHFLKTSIWNPATNNFPLEKCLTETSFALWLRINDQLGTNNSSRKSFNRISNITNTSVDMTKPKYWNNIHIVGIQRFPQIRGNYPSVIVRLPFTCVRMRRARQFLVSDTSLWQMPWTYVTQEMLSSRREKLFYYLGYFGDKLVRETLSFFHPSPLRVNDCYSFGSLVWG